MGGDLDDVLAESLRAADSEFSATRTIGEARRSVREGVSRRRRAHAVGLMVVVAFIVATHAAISHRPTGRDATGIDVALAAPSAHPATTGLIAPDCRPACPMGSGGHQPSGQSAGKGNGRRALTSLGPASLRPGQSGEWSAAGPPATVVPPGPAPPSPPAPTGTVPPPPPPTFTYTQADTGRTVQVPDGARIVVELHHCPGATWAGPSSSNTTVLRPDGPASDPVSGPASATFTATGAGTASITAQVVRTPCAIPTTRFVLTVQVG